MTPEVQQAVMGLAILFVFPALTALAGITLHKLFKKA